LQFFKVLAGVLALCFGALCAISVDAQSVTSKKTCVPASVPALLGLQCKVHPKGSDPSPGLDVFTDKDPAAYTQWLEAASRPGRMLEAKEPARPTSKVINDENPAWIGAVMMGLLNHISTRASFNVPKAIAGGDQTESIRIAIWNALNGFGTDALIQGGSGLNTSTSAAAYFTWRQYCRGDGPNLGNFTPNPGDFILSQEWYCDASGNLDLDGGTGCTGVRTFMI
jgi:hypothetical protein